MGETAAAEQIEGGNRGERERVKVRAKWQERKRGRKGADLT